MKRMEKRPVILHMRKDTLILLNYWIMPKKMFDLLIFFFFWFLFILLPITGFWFFKG